MSSACRRGPTDKGLADRQLWNSDRPTLLQLREAISLPCCPDFGVAYPDDGVQASSPEGVARMIHPLLTKLVTQPQVFVEHLSAYGALATLEARETGRAWQRRAVTLAICAVMAVLGLVFTGVALMLVAAWPWQNMPAPWAMLSVPAVMWLVAGVSWWLGTRHPAAKPFAQLRQQLSADAQLMRDIERSS